MLQCLRKEANISHLHNPGLLYIYLTLILHLSHDLVDNHKKDHRGTTRSLSGLLCSFRKIPTVSYCGWLDKMRVRKDPGSTYELRWNSILTIVMQKLPDDIPVNTVEGLFEIIKRSFIMASAIHWKVLRVSLGWQYGPAVHDLTFLKPVEPAWLPHTCQHPSIFQARPPLPGNRDMAYLVWLSSSIRRDHPRGVVNGFVGKITEGTETSTLHPDLRSPSCSSIRVAARLGPCQRYHDQFGRWICPEEFWRLVLVNDLDDLGENYRILLSGHVLCCWLGHNG